MTDSEAARIIAKALRFMAQFDIRPGCIGPRPEEAETAFIGLPWPGKGLINLGYCTAHELDPPHKDIHYEMTEEGLRVAGLKNSALAVRRAMQKFRSSLN